MFSRKGSETLQSKESGEIEMREFLNLEIVVVY